MNLASVALLAFSMSTDAFAAAIGKGLALERPHWREAVRTGLIFGVIEALTPVIGWALGRVAANYVEAWDHWIAFTLLGGLGMRMILASLRAPDDEDEAKPNRHGFWLLAVTGLATSIDAMVVGASLAFIEVEIVPIAAAIGLATLVMVSAGVMLGRVLGVMAGRWAEAVGGFLLIGIGTTILVEHLRIV
ncbi:manganese efflux pump MntP [Piscinibacter koreensis]|uniref:Putative manganese efflux pump MntP n=1 Tax=Piscinibacter koreensis TaxID=2742824 RepID=A0A7Y6TXQ7_9BURK|nr:manganese efflux pump MntP [Schlegelella koreensis]NUZ07311.1 manganese efflux pump MntP [Schlegelella koreensis]